jgi:diguanylate cyclase (GGDEF)-like protein
MSEITKRLEKADKFLQKGKLPSALEELRQVLMDDPANDSARQQAAELAISLNLGSEATDYLGELFDHAATLGKHSDAINYYKKLLRFTTPATDRTFRYALIVESSNPREAIEAYHSCLGDLLARARKDDAYLAVKRLVGLEPTAENLRRQADLAESMGDREAAADCLLQVGRMEENAGRDAAAIYGHAYSLNPQKPDIEMAHARCLLAAGRAEDCVAALRAQSLPGPEYLQLYAQALLGANQVADAEAPVTRLYEQGDQALALVSNILDAHVRNGHTGDAIRYARALEPRAKERGGFREFVNAIRDFSDKHSTDLELLEFVAQLYNASNREHEYCAALLKLFELHYAQRNFNKAADCLDRASDVDAYEPGHQERLAMLQGKIDGNRYNAILNRLTTVTRVGTKAEDEEELEFEQAEQSPADDGEPTVLEDLMLQAEIFLQYSMRSKAVERLERIAKLFPHEEDKRDKLAQLYAAAAFVPRYESAKPVTPMAGAKPGQAAANENAVDNFARVTEITRNIARQSSVKAVLFATVNDVGRHWNVSRCVAGLCSPGKAPSAAMEYCATNIAKSDVMGLARLIPALQAQAIKAGGTVAFDKAQRNPQLESVHSVLVAQKIESLMAVPLMDGQEPIGIVILEQCTPRAFRNVDQVVLTTISEQVVMAVNNARLRSLVKNLAVTDERSGLMRRSSYLDVLSSEVQRGLTQRTSVTIMLMHFGSASALLREVGEERVEEAMQEIGHTVTANIRQTDLAVRYSLTSIALILSDTNDKSTFFVLDKLRKALANSRMPGQSEPVTVTAGIAELVMQPKYDPADIVTEGVNRAEAALETARHEGSDKAHSIAPGYETGAYAAR